MITAPTARPNYAFPGDPIASGLKRHHIIPWTKMVSAGAKMVNDSGTKSKAYINEVMKILVGRQRKTAPTQYLLNLGAYTPDDFADAVVNERADAVQSWFEIVTWLPGNLVIGPDQRGKDSGNGFDDEAFQLLDSDEAERKLGKLRQERIDAINMLKDGKATAEQICNCFTELAKGDLIELSGWKK